MNRSQITVCLVSGCFLLMMGCSGKQSRISQPSYSSAPGEGAIEAYDANSDGALSGEELDKVPALREAIKQVDTDGDGRLTPAEIDARVEAWKESRIGQMAAICEVTFDGKPLANAVVVFEPEPFLGSNLPSGSGTTENDGIAGVGQDNGQFGMPCGWYKIRITSPDREIPKRYNTDTKLGCEVANYSHWQNAGAIKLNLTSK